MSIPLSVVSFHSPDMNRVPLSVLTSHDLPYDCKISVLNYDAKCRVFLSFIHGIKWLILVRYSITTSMVLYLSVFGKSVMKSSLWGSMSMICRKRHLAVGFVWCLLDHLAPLSGVTNLDVLFDYFSHLWPLVLSAHQLGTFCCSALSCEWFIVAFAYRTCPKFSIDWYPDLPLAPYVFFFLFI